MKSNSLESKLCILVAGLLFALLLSVGYVQMHEQQNLLSDIKSDKYESMTKILSLSCRILSKTNDLAQYKELASRFMSVDTDIVYVTITDSKGQIIFYDIRDIGSSPSKGTFKLPSILTNSYNESSIVRMPVTLPSGKSGNVAVAYNPATIDFAADIIKTKLLFTFAIAFLIGFIGAISLARSIVSPIRKFIDAAKSIAAGNMETTVQVDSYSEIEQLGESFNSMTVALKEKEARLIERANTDSLTELYNHRYFQERLASEIRRSDRYDRPLSVIMLDIDHFKTLNDTFGHPVGDKVLQEVAKLLSSQSRDIDVIARYGGEEFALILPETTLSDAMTAAERLRTAVQRHYFKGKEHEAVPVTISLGVAQYPLHSTEREGLIMAADLAMYQAKSTGRNRAVAYSRDGALKKSNDPYQLYLLLHATDVGTIEAISGAVDTKSLRPMGFSKIVARDAVSLAKELSLSEGEQNEVRIASLLYDVGKLGVPDSVFTKPDQLTEDEQKIMYSHPKLGHSIVQRSPHLKSMLPGILHHHERWDGRGYPNGLAGESIPLIARIIAVVDAYHAMVSESSHSRAKTNEAAIKELLDCAGTQFDPDVVKAFVKVMSANDVTAAKV